MDVTGLEPAPCPNGDTTRSPAQKRAQRPLWFRAEQGNRLRYQVENQPEAEVLVRSNWTQFRGSGSNGGSQAS